MNISTDHSGGTPPQPNLPPGFRFHPTDEELLVHYLKKKAISAPLPVDIIADVDLYKFDPWELPAKALFGEEEWYFFSPRDRKYPNGARPNRAATSGYWKATGTDKPVLASGTQKIGVKKALVFYGGKPPKGVKTNWVMHEYRLVDAKSNINKPPILDFSNKKNSLRLDDWVLCRIYKKSNMSKIPDGEKDDLINDIFGHMHRPISVGGMQNIGKMIALQPPKNGGFSYYGQNAYEGMAISGNVPSHNGVFPDMHSACSSLKRALPPPVWPEEEDQNAAAAGSPNKRLNAGDCLNFQPAVLGAEGNFRPPYQISGLNWYS